MTDSSNQNPTPNFVGLLTDHQPALRAFVRFLMAGSDEAADVIQEVNILLWEKRNQFKLGTNFRAWAFTIARFKVLGYRRQQRKDGALLFDPDLVERLADEWQADPDQHSRKLLMLEHCLEKLSDFDLSVVRARYGGHGAIEGLAQKTGRTANSLSLKLSRLRAALKQCVQQELNAEGGLQ
jgi:RNA polymerase sigma-70 factor (ECF subfamily)